MSTNDNSEHGHGLARFVTVPNLLSVSRLLMLPVVLLLLVRGQSAAALIAMAVSWITDGLDGFIARRLGQVTEVGKVLDHLVDKVWVASVLVTLVALRDLPLVLAASVIIRDLLILAGSAVLLKRRGSFLSSDVVGKVTGFAFALLMVYYTAWPPFLRPYKHYADYTVMVLVAVSFINYLGRYLRRMTRFRLPDEHS